MRRLIFSLALVAFALGILMLQSGHQPLNAQSSGYTNRDFCGNYALQYSGYKVFPADSPLAFLNGPWAQNGRAVADGEGNGSADVVASFNGQIVRLRWVGTYQVSRNGTMKISLVGNIPQLGELPIELEGVICEKGRRVQFINSALLIPGLPSGFTGEVGVGSLIQQ